MQHKSATQGTITRITAARHQKKEDLMSDKLQMFENRLLKMYKHKSKLAKRQNVSCYRVYNHDIPEFPFAVELYEDKVYVAEFVGRRGLDEDAHEAWLEECLEIIAKVLTVDAAKIFMRQRKRMTHRTQSQYEKLSFEEQFYSVHENSLKFLVNLTDYLDTGLFLDHRATRQLLKNEAKDKRVLNLFCYTGSFSVYAAAGGAKSVASVDLSKTYLNWAKDNFDLNGLKDDKRYEFIHADVMQFMNALVPDSFDLVIVDPPTFSNSKRMKDFFDVQRDHVAMINTFLKAVSDGGVIYFSTNFSRFVLEKENIQATTIKDITKATMPFDFEGNLKRFCFRIEK